MKRLLIVFLAITTLFTMSACDDMSKNQDISETEPDVCVDHSSELAAWSIGGDCKICEAIAGKSFDFQCQTWEDVVTCAGFDEYSYKLNVTEHDNIVSITLTFDDTGYFSDNNWVGNFMSDSYLAFVRISWFTQNKSSVATPDRFQKYFVIKMDFPGGTIICLPDEYFRESPIGITTRLHVDEESPNKFMVERWYNIFFKSVILPETK